MADWITTDEALEIGTRDYQQEYHIEYLRQLLREQKIAGRKFARSWQVNRRSWIEYLEAAANSADARRGGRNPKAS